MRKMVISVTALIALLTAHSAIADPLSYVVQHRNLFVSANLGYGALNIKNTNLRYRFIPNLARVYRIL